LNGFDEKHLLELCFGGNAAIVGVHGIGRDVVSRPEILK